MNDERKKNLIDVLAYLLKSDGILKALDDEEQDEYDNLSESAKLSDDGNLILANSNHIDDVRNNIYDAWTNIQKIINNN